MQSLLQTWLITKFLLLGQQLSDSKTENLRCYVYSVLKIMEFFKFQKLVIWI